jgi:hypothetical protein
LRHLTDFSWDEVHLFHDAVSRGTVTQVVGSPVICDKYYNSSASLLVFEQNGEIVEAIGITGDYVEAKATAGLQAHYAEPTHQMCSWSLGDSVTCA